MCIRDSLYSSASGEGRCPLIELKNISFTYENSREGDSLSLIHIFSAHQADDEMGGDEKENRWLYSPGKGRYLSLIHI